MGVGTGRQILKRRQNRKIVILCRYHDKLYTIIMKKIDKTDNK